MASVKFALSEKGKELIVIDNFKFRYHKELSGGVKRWVCSFGSKCPAFLKTDGKSNVIVQLSDNHNHEPLCEKVLNRNLLSNAIKRKATEDINEKPSKLVHKELRNSDVDTLTTVDVNCLRKNIYHARRKDMPKLPMDIQQVHTALESRNVVTNRKEQFLLVNDKINNIVIFSCKTNLEFLCSLDTIYVDGTFNFCTKFFLQMFTIHGLKGDHYVPLVFCLLPNKRKSTYHLAFNYVKEECQKLSDCFTPAMVAVDFEEAIQQCVEEIWPESKIIGCKFHLGQSWYRKIKQLGLSHEYRDQNSEIGAFLRTCFGLPFLDPKFVGDCFAIDIAAIQPNHPQVTKFTDYLVENYIAESSKFPPAIWAENSSSLKRTTNACESFHSRFNSSFYHTHPNIYLFLNVLIEFQCDSYIRIRSVNNNEKKIYSSKTLSNKEFLDFQIFQLNNGYTTMFDFVKIVGNRFKIS